MKKSSLILLVFLLSGCATLKKSFCDCQKNEVAAAPAPPAKPVEKKEKIVDKGSYKESSTLVSNEDLESVTRMSKAVDSYVFKNQPEDFNTLCQDPHFDCFVDDKRYPKGKMRVKRKTPPFLSGSKMGMRDEKRLKVKYDFYP